MNDTATITTTVEPSPLIPTTKWEKGARVVIISLDGIEIERLLMFPAKGETLAGLIAAHGYTTNQPARLDTIHYTRYSK